MKQLFLRFEHWTTSISMMIACLMMTLASGFGIHQIFTRFIIESPAEWTEVLIRFSLIWMVFLGIPTAFRQGAMVSVDMLYRLSGERMRRFLDAVVAIAALTLCSII
ncbi:TRAP transporter small permease, partial [uncultured Limnohabitans sp.]|uniref:TRAP transporter small permease n=1 Tax=uncultured Limnohabitans sp. TaxID=768543 RepID=UPI00262F1551